jgi:hypothetical protein
VHIDMEWSSVMKRIVLVLRCVGLSMALMQFWACAGTTAATYSWKTPPNAKEVLDKYREVVVVVQPKEGVSLVPAVRDRLNRQICELIKTESGGKYVPVAPGTAGPGTLGAQVFIARYDDGIAFSQYVFSGQVRMRIDGDVVLSDWQTKRMLAEFNVTKTLEWEKLYGTSNMIDDLEPEFARGVVAGIAQQDQ